MDPLAKLNAVPGVMGSIAYDAAGQVLSQAVPPELAAARLRAAVGTLLSHGAGLEAAVGSVRALDLRFAQHRVVVRAGDATRLLFLCSPTVNLQTLMMSASDALRSFEKAEGTHAPRAGDDPRAAEPPKPPEPPRPAEAQGGLTYRLVQRIDQVIIRAGLDRFKTRGKIAFKVGFSLDLVDQDTPDEPAKLQKLRAAAADVLGHPL